LAMPANVRYKVRLAIAAHEHLAGLLPAERQVIAVLFYERGVTRIGWPRSKQCLSLDLEYLRIEVPEDREARSRARLLLVFENRLRHDRFSIRNLQFAITELRGSFRAWCRSR